MIENVRGIVGRKFEGYRDEIVRDFKELGYEYCGWEALDAGGFSCAAIPSQSQFCP